MTPPPEEPEPPPPSLRSLPALEWEVHLAREQPQKLPWVLLALAASGALAYLLMRHPFFVLAAVAVMTGATAEYLFPIRYRLNARGAESRNGLSVRRILWEDVRKAYLAPNGVKLSPLDRPSRAEAYRGVFLRFRDNQEEVVAAVKRFRQVEDDAGQAA